MPDLENEIKKKAKTMGKKVAKKILLILLPILLIFMLLAAAVYFITIDDGTYKEGDWGNTNYGASQYVNNVEVSTDGKISSTTNAKDLWKKMKDNGSDVDKYLDKPEELLKLMNAEVVTQYPDLRKDPDKKIDWDKVLKDSDSLQGIIKFKRAGTDNTKTTMTYVDQETFQGYIDEYIGEYAYNKYLKNNINEKQDVKRYLLYALVLSRMYGTQRVYKTILQFLKKINEED